MNVKKKDRMGDECMVLKLEVALAKDGMGKCCLR